MNKVLFYVPNLIDYFRLVLIVVSKLNNNFFFITLAFNIILQKKINKGWIYIDNPYLFLSCYVSQIFLDRM